MRFLTAAIAVLLHVGMAVASADDPVVMKINGVPINSSEFEYYYEKYGTDNISGRMTAEDYARSFIDFKLKVTEAYALRLDTLQSLNDISATRINRKPMTVTCGCEAVEAEAHKVYDEIKADVGRNDILKVAHILIYVRQDATNAEFESARRRADSLCVALKNGADFASLARRYSDDKASAQNGGVLSWLMPGQSMQEFEAAAYALKPGDTSGTVLSPMGFHVIKMLERNPLQSYDSLRSDLIKVVEARRLRLQIAKGVVPVDADTVTVARENLILTPQKKEIRDGMLALAATENMIESRTVNALQAIMAYFGNNKKRYKWDEPRFKGVVFHVKDGRDVKAVKALLKKVPYDKWEDALHDAFNTGVAQRVTFSKGLFKQGDNPLVDKLVFKRQTDVKPDDDFPIDAFYGKKLKKGPDSIDDVMPLITADYEDELVKQWTNELRSKYQVEVFDNVLKTVNKQNK